MDTCTKSQIFSGSEAYTTANVIYRNLYYHPLHENDLVWQSATSVHMHCIRLQVCTNLRQVLNAVMK